MIFRGELIETIRLAAPMALTQLGQIAMMTTDLALIGRLGDKAVAAAALAIAAKDPDAVILMAPSDHYVPSGSGDSTMMVRMWNGTSREVGTL